MDILAEIKSLLTGSVSPVLSENAALKLDLTKSQGEFTAAVVERDAARAEVVTLKAELTTAKAAVTDFDVKVEQKASVVAQQRIASLGHPPITVTASDGLNHGKPAAKGVERWNLAHPEFAKTLNN